MNDSDLNPSSFDDEDEELRLVASQFFNEVGEEDGLSSKTMKDFLRLYKAGKIQIEVSHGLTLLQFTFAMSAFILMMAGIVWMIVFVVDFFFGNIVGNLGWEHRWEIAYGGVIGAIKGYKECQSRDWLDGYDTRKKTKAFVIIFFLLSCLFGAVWLL